MSDRVESLTGCLSDFATVYSFIHVLGTRPPETGDVGPPSSYRFHRRPIRSRGVEATLVSESSSTRPR